MQADQHAYIAEKLAEFDERRAERRRRLFAGRPPTRGRSRRPLAPVVSATGRRMRKLGEAMERWASPVTRGGEMESRRGAGSL